MKIKRASRSRYSRMLVFVLLTGSGGLCGACQGRHENSVRTSIIDPCLLVTRADAQRLLGAPVKPAIRSDVVLMATGRECRYVTSASMASSGSTWGIDILVYDDATIGKSDSSMFKSARDYFRRDMAALHSSGTTLVPISNLGDQAYWQPGTDLLHVLDHGVYVMLDVDADFHIPPGPGGQVDRELDAAKRAAEVTLAQDTILPRLKHFQSTSINKLPSGGSGGHSS
jgi:hypothetical protein